MTNLIAIFANVIIFGAAAHFFGLLVLVPVGLAYMVGVFQIAASRWQ